MKRSILLLSVWAACIALTLPGFGEPALLAGYECKRIKVPAEDTFYNIQLACRALQNTVLLEGKTFSFNKSIEKVRQYFKPGPFVMGTSTIMKDGGGICQVSTALYQAALKAGLKIREQHPHSAFLSSIDYCKKGQDAAVSMEPLKDLRITNNAGGPVLIQFFARDKTTVEIRIIRLDSPSPGPVSSTKGSPGLAEKRIPGRI